MKLNFPFRVARTVRGMGLLLYLCALTAGTGLAEPLSLSRIDYRPDRVQLFWQGGMPPFMVQRSGELQSWTVAGLTDQSEFEFSPTNRVEFYRVLESGYVGQWRVDEGEFGAPLGRHRMKSIWDFYLTDTEAEPNSAASFFKAVPVQVHYLDGTEVKSFAGRFEDLPEGNYHADDQKILVNWTWPDSERRCSLEMTFFYKVNELRSQNINLSDPTIVFECQYSEPQPEVTDLEEVTMVTKDSTALVEVDDPGERPPFWDRTIRFTKAGVSIDSRFRIGVPLIEGEPAFIFKTPLLVAWEKTTITGLTSEPIELTGRFSQTYDPSHHNFVETLWLEPGLEPGMDPGILAELEEKNIRFIIPRNPTAFPEEQPTLRVFGFDDTLRDVE